MSAYVVNLDKYYETIDVDNFLFFEEYQRVSKVTFAMAKSSLNGLFFNEQELHFKRPYD